MDVSKLPKLSDTKAADPDAAAAEPVLPVAVRELELVRPTGIGPDVWISTVIGLLFIGLGFTFARYAAGRLTGQAFHTGVDWTEGPRAGQEVAYFDLQGYSAWTDMGIFLFGLTLLLEAASKAAVVLRPSRFSRGLLMASIGLTIAGVVLNGVTCVLLLGVGITPLISGLAVAFGGYVLLEQVRALSLTRPRRAGVSGG